jgi:phage terminase large subunit-like protein
MRPEDWERFACGRWVSAERSWLPAGAWAACCDPAAEIPDGARVFLGVDIGRKHDSSAIVVAFPHDGQVTVRAFVYDSPGAGEESQDLAVIEGKIRQLAGQYDVRECVFDPWSFTRSAQLLGDEGLTMVEFPQSHSRMVPASSRLFEAIRDKRVIHDGDPILAANVNAGVTVETDRGWRLTKRKATDKIDALIALAVAVERAESAPKRRRLQIFVTDPRTGNMVDAVAEGVREIAEARERDGQPEPATGPVIFA